MTNLIEQREQTRIDAGPGFVKWIHDYFCAAEKAITRVTYERMLDAYIEGATLNESAIEAATAKARAPLEALQQDLDLAKLVIQQKNDRIASVEVALEKAEKENEQLKTERDFKNKTDPIHRLHNLCAGLTEHKNESPFSQEAWDAVDAETVRMQAEIADLKFELSQVRRLVRSTRKRKHVGPIPKAGSKA